ncbi:hypothetical protein pipiens_019406 [Culex pipiens pipiens]|uniref:Uncharacterized protein n=1 Tax=Culex pipiens pipiens TaxID=38569 RepID=A0ABD1DUN9_CULPP
MLKTATGHLVPGVRVPNTKNVKVEFKVQCEKWIQNLCVRSRSIRTLPNGAEQVVIEEMMVKKQHRNLMTENKPNEYPRTVLPASGGNVRRPIRSFAGAPAVEISSRTECLHQQYRRALILEFLLFLADTNSFAGASNGGPLLNLDHREDSINSNGLPAPVPMLAEFFKDGQLQCEHSRSRPHRRDSSAQ